MKKRGQLISMDLLIGFIIFILGISLFFYFFRGVPFLRPRKSLDLQADYVFSNLESIPNPRINFLKNYKVNENKLKLFAGMSYNRSDKDNDKLRDDRENDFTLNEDNPDTDDDGYLDNEEMKRGTKPDSDNSIPEDTEEISGDMLGDGLDDEWEDEHGITVPVENTFNYAYEDLDDRDDFDNPGDFNHLNYDSSVDCALGTEITSNYNEDHNANKILDDSTESGFYFDDAEDDKYNNQKRCNYLGYNNDYYPKEEEYPLGDTCKKCIPNKWLYVRDLKKGDFDNDGLNDINELNIFGTNPFSYDDTSLSGKQYPIGSKYTLDSLNIISLTDSDSDYLPDEWEQKFGLKIISGCGTNNFLDSCKFGDPDDDWLSNWEELKYGTDPNNPDTDGNGINDFYEELKPLNMDVQSLLLEQINFGDFKEIDVCIYFEKKDGEIIYHVGKGDFPENMIELGNDGNPIKCGDETHLKIPQIDANPQCITLPYVESMIMSKPVLFEYPDDTNEFLNMKILICAIQ
jgi:hypothetical protein